MPPPLSAVSPPPTGVELTAASRRARADWVDQNPLRAWRHSQTPKVSILEAAERIGVGMSMVQMYERGVHKPGEKAHAGLERCLGRDWAAAWTLWLASKPAA